MRTINKEAGLHEINFGLNLSSMIHNKCRIIKFQNAKSKSSNLTSERLPTLSHKMLPEHFHLIACVNDVEVGNKKQRRIMNSKQKK